MSNQNDNNNNNNINSKDFMIGTLIGGLLGASAALLMAPKSGKELRQDLNEQADTVRLKTGEFRNTAVEKGSAFAEAAKERSDQWSKVVAEQSAGLKEKARTWTENMKSTDVAGTEDETAPHPVEGAEKPVEPAKPVAAEEEVEEERETQSTNV